MNILSSLVPGVRELRSPLSAGLLWLAAVASLLAAHHAILIPHAAVTEDLQHLPSTWAVALLTSSALTLGYLVGSVMISITTPILRIAANVLRDAVYDLNHRAAIDGPGSLSGRRLISKLDANTRRVSFAARRLIMDRVTRSLGEIGVPGTASLVFPVEQVMDTLAFSAPQLAASAPSQYQEYNRARSEADFRLAIVPPMIFLALVAPVNGRMWIVASIFLAGFVLLLQALYQERKSNDILANAAYLDYVSLPMIQAVIDYLSEASPPQSDGEWIGAVIAGLANRAFYDACTETRRTLVKYSNQNLADAESYLTINCPGQTEILKRSSGASEKRRSPARSAFAGLPRPRAPEVHPPAHSPRDDASDWRKGR